MKIHIRTLKAWAKRKPHPELKAKLRRAFIRFAPVTINGRPVCIPAKAAVKWAQSRAVESVSFNPESSRLEIVAGTSRICLKCPTESIPLEDAWSMETCLRPRIRDYDRCAITELRCA